MQDCGSSRKREAISQPASDPEPEDGSAVKAKIERATVDAFVEIHNQTYGTAYSVREYGDHNGDRPDACCVTEDGREFNVEVTVTEDRPGDIQWVLGRTDQRPCQGRLGCCLQGNVLAQLTVRLDKKSLMRYGGRTALVIRDASGVGLGLGRHQAAGRRVSS